jgi:abhydrolase domain-containing protein 17
MIIRGARHRILRMLLYLTIAYAMVTVVAFVLADRVIFMPPSASYAAGEFRRVDVEGGDSVAVSYLPNEAARYTILYSHGNAEDLGHVLPVLRQLHGAGFGVIAYDYRGYGQSTGGRPTARKATEDIAAVYQFAVGDLGLRPDQLILHGRSLGSGPTVELAVRHPVAGVILESAFTSTYRVLTRVGLLPFDRFRNARYISDIRSPILVIHGTLDRVIPPAHGRRLFALAPEPKQSLWVVGAGHNDLVHIAGETYAAALTKFAVLLEQTSAAPPSR